MREPISNPYVLSIAETRKKVNMDCNMWRIETFLDMEEKPEMEDEIQRVNAKEIEFYAITESNELPF